MIQKQAKEILRMTLVAIDQFLWLMRSIDRKLMIDSQQQFNHVTLATHLGISKERVRLIQQLGYSNISSRWGLANLQNITYGKAKNAVINFWNVIVKKNLLFNIATEDESWLHHYDLEEKKGKAWILALWFANIQEVKNATLCKKPYLHSVLLCQTRVRH